MREKNPVWNTDAEHEIGDGRANAALAAEHAVAVSLRINAPPAEIRPHPFRRNCFVSPLGELPDFFQTFPGILCLFQPFRPLRVGFFLFRRHWWIGFRSTLFSIDKGII